MFYKGTSPTRLACTQLDRRYFGKGEAEDITGALFLDHRLIFRMVDSGRADFLKRIEKDLEIVVEGSLCGLARSRIRLHRTGAFSGQCEEADSREKEIFPVTFRLINTVSGETLATYRQPNGTHRISPGPNAEIQPGKSLSQF